MEQRKYEVRIRLSKEEMEKITKIANKLEIPKAALIRNLALASLEDAELLDKLGFFEIAKLLRKLKEKAFKEKKLNLTHI